MQIPRAFAAYLVVRVATMFLASPVQAQNVTTWHNDNYRTGQQLNETILSPSTNWNNFGLLWQYSVQGDVYAQPLAVAQVSAPNCNPTPCNLIFIATEEDMLYGFDANSHNKIWGPTNLATDSASNGTPFDCRTLPEGCSANNSPIYPYIGVTGTPVIDPNAGILYVVSAVQVQWNPYHIEYFLHAINITNGAEEKGSPVQISASVPGPTTPPDMNCDTGRGQGTLTFDPDHHLQRTGLLLVNLTNGPSVVYIGFNPIFGETENGWILGYSYTSSAGFSQTPIAQVATTPYGTGGGVWEAGAGLASDGSSIFAPTGNGTFDATNGGADYGDSMLKLTINQTSGALSITDYFTPMDWNSRCLNSADKDFGSGGVLLFPDYSFQGHPMMVSADKESYIWFVRRDTLGGVNGQIQQSKQPSNPPSGYQPGYWSSPAYWNSGSTYNLYYGVDETIYGNAPWPIYLYQLQTSGSPISSSQPIATPTHFCGNPHAPTPSISANGVSGGLLWAIESSNQANNPPSPKCNGAVKSAVLHAYDATSLSSKYTSTSLQTTIGNAVNFPTPTIFNGKVYMGTKTVSTSGTNVDVFGLCSSQSSGCLP